MTFIIQKSSSKRHTMASVFDAAPPRLLQNNLMLSPTITVDRDHQSFPTALSIEVSCHTCRYKWLIHVAVLSQLPDLSVLRTTRLSSSKSPTVLITKGRKLIAVILSRASLNHRRFNVAFRGTCFPNFCPTYVLHTFGHFRNALRFRPVLAYPYFTVMSPDKYRLYFRQILVDSRGDALDFRLQLCSLRLTWLASLSDTSRIKFTSSSDLETVHGSNPWIHCELQISSIQIIFVIT